MKMTPGAAILWTLLVPGLAHVRMGHAARGLLAFVTAVGLFWAGVAIVGDRIWYFQLFEPFDLVEPVLARIPVQLLPESPNLGCCIVLALMRDSGTEQELYTWLRSIRVPVPGEHIGLFLMGITGPLNALWAADAHWIAQDRPMRRPAPATAAFISWWVPGAGHVLAGQKSKGILIGAAVVVMFALGLALSHGHAVDRPLRSAWWIPQVLFGSGTLFATVVTAPIEEGAPPAWIDHGIAMCAVAGLMNLIVMIDAYTVAEEREGAAAPEATPERAGGSA